MGFTSAPTISYPLTTMKAAEQFAHEQATGMHENPSGFGIIYDDNGNALRSRPAADLFNNGESIELPNAGSSSYKKLFKFLGYSEWTFAIRDEDVWYVAFQSNRHPRCGFRYTRNEMSFDSFEQACKAMEG
jgi:hypothetical protein